MLARVFVRLLAVLLFVLAASTARPAHASTLLFYGVVCEQYGTDLSYALYTCTAYVSGGTGSYTYTWNIRNTWGFDYTFTGRDSFNGSCRDRETRYHRVTVTDSSGATVSGNATIFYCHADDGSID